MTLEPSRHMALPNSGMWLLDFLQVRTRAGALRRHLPPSCAAACSILLCALGQAQDKFYDVRGPSFVIQRAESGEDGGGARRRRRSKARKLVRQQEAGGAAGSGGSSRALRLINRVVQHHPGSIMLLEGGVVDVSEWMEPCGDDAPQPQPPPANTTCTGIVRVEQPEEEAPEVRERNCCAAHAASPREMQRAHLRRARSRSLSRRRTSTLTAARRPGAPRR